MALGWAKRTPDPQKPSNRPSTGSTSNNSRRSMAPPPAPSPKTANRQTTLSQELYRQSTPKNDPVPAFPGYVPAPVNRSNDENTPVIAPPANMVTASQELRGISHGVDDGVSTDDGVTTDDGVSTDDGISDPSDVKSESAPAPANDRQPALEAPAPEPEKDPLQARYQLEVDRLARLEELEDPEYPGPSQSTPTPSCESIPTQELVDLTNLNSGAVRSQTLEDEGLPTRPRTKMSTVVNAVEACRNSFMLDNQEEVLIERIDDDDDDEVFVPAAAQPSEKTGKKKRDQYGVRHTLYEHLKSPEGRRERDELILSVRTNWRPKSDLAIWPDGLAPTSGGATIQVRDVSSALWRALKPLAEATKGNPALAHKAMIEAVDNRVQISGKTPKLIAEDIEVALRSIHNMTPRKRARVTNAQAGPSVEDDPAPKRARQSGRVHTDELRQVVEESAETIIPSSPVEVDMANNEPDADMGEPEGPATAGLPATLSEILQAVEVVEQPQPTKSAPGLHPETTPSLSPEILSSLSEVRKALRGTPTSRDVVISTDSEWSQYSEGLKGLFEVYCTKAFMMGKGNIVVTFRVGDGTITS
ncbi:hypothetical protein LTR56_018817 [Elasticomyces elasticus]|nr:hypothetical protein LTR22_024580 [Elasticomyces elasticus]KAK3628080.1 hypothetical protein LTR56_018817 [Elasticomyces elasticus]KAK4907044.1 hypothetical protein LTR49_023897 [Elasticomyces elasticus]KAK5742753.1 hypothetical protein LTS12_024120 [Elasticomyces elasticus]